MVDEIIPGVKDEMLKIAGEYRRLDCHDVYGMSYSKIKDRKN